MKCVAAIKGRPEEVDTQSAKYVFENHAVVE
jgi:hypothetical protein